MKKLIVSVVLVILVLSIGTIGLAEGNSAPTEPQMPGRVEGTGTHFELNDSDYLNITVDSSEPVHLMLESAPEMVVMYLEAASGASSAVMILDGFSPLTTYHRYEDDYHNLATFTTDDKGGYSYTQDLSQPHLVFIQPRASTKFIRDDATGGDATLIGTWDPVTKTSTLTMDLNETIQIDSDNITLDGNGHTITGTGTGSGVYLSNRKGVTIKNLNIESFYYGIWLWSSSNNTLSDNNAWNSQNGIYLYQSANSNTLRNNTANSNGYHGIYLSSSSNNILANNTVDLNNYNGIYLYQSSNSNTLTGNVASNNDHGIYLSYSSNNTLSNHTLDSNIYYGIRLSYSSDNTIYNNNFINNYPASTQARVHGGSGNVFNLDRPVGGNYWSDYDTPAEGCIDADNDGFADSPYFLYGDADYLPWTRQDGWLNRPPIANANGPYLGSEGSPIIFNGSGSSDPDGTIILYEWDLDCDGQYDATGVNPSYNWGDDYSGCIGLKVSDNDGLTDTEGTTVIVSNVAPTVEAGPDQVVNEGDLVNFSGSFTDPGWLDTHTYTWDFGDGGTGSGTLTPTNIYCDNGVYTVTLTVTDDDGGIGTDTLTVTVNNVPPTVEAGPDQEVFAGGTVQFNGSFTDPGACDTHIINWDFGNGSTSSGTLTPTHVYYNKGTYTVTLTVTDDGGVGIDTLEVVVTPIPATVEVKPDTLNRTRKGKEKALTAYIELPGFDLNAIDVSTITLSTSKGSVPAQLILPVIGDYDADGIPDLMVKFKSQAVVEIVDVGDKVKVTISGSVGEIIFEGSDEIRVIQ